MKISIRSIPAHALVNHRSLREHMRIDVGVDVGLGSVVGPSRGLACAYLSSWSAPST